MPWSGALRARLERWTGRFRTREKRFLERPPRAGVSGTGFRVAQVLWLALRRFHADDAADRATALAFNTLLSIVPLLLVALSLFHALGFSDANVERIHRWLFAHFVPETAAELRDALGHAVQALRARSDQNGLLGGALLIALGWRLHANLSRIFGRIWGSRRSALSWRRLATFVAVVLVGPLLAAAWIYLPTLLVPMIRPGPYLGDVMALLIGFLVVFLAYLHFPGRPTRLSPALLGATIAGLLWEALRIGFEAYVRHAWRFETLVPELGVLPVFLLWLVMSWAFFIFGAEVAFVAQEFNEALARHRLLFRVARQRRRPDRDPAIGAEGSDKVGSQPA